MVKLAHIINPVIVKESSDLFIAQPITFATLKTAQDYAKSQGLEVELYSAQYPEDHSIIPSFLTKTPDLENSVLDLQNFSKKRKLPFIKDILDRLYENSDADYFIYTNVDIAVLPNFYLAVAELINQGYDGFIINRRTINKQFQTVDQIPLMYAEVGLDHPGFDCFIFPKQVYPNFKLNNVFIGFPPIDYAFIINMLCNFKNFEIFRNLHLTFHIGNDKVWEKGSQEEYFILNTQETDKILEHYLSKDESFKNNPLVSRYLNTLSVSIKNEKYTDQKQYLLKRKILMTISYKIKGLSNRINKLAKKIDKLI